ncbi:hypothetical protein [Fructilactobacillus cliffordii]|uniref:Uncharacterized protein n=1 Tax=Fructilactobacillus cliffordii TaxID=2940299 RepID=A0A9Q9E1A6_9LACO|nr:hypothetical protein [Fructilactobacillus cliffordii]USS89991.1 hypothetical protein M3M40_07140 [Fructilactobacillus cliffordii]
MKNKKLFIEIISAIIIILVITIAFTIHNHENISTRKQNNATETKHVKQQKKYVYINYTWNGKEVRDQNPKRQTNYLEFEKSYKGKDIIDSLTVPENMEPIKGQKAIMTGKPNQHITIKLQPKKDIDGNAEQLYSLEVKENGKWTKVEKDPFGN